MKWCGFALAHCRFLFWNSWLMRPLNVGRKPFGYRGATASHWVHGVCVFTFDESLVVQVSVSQFSIVARFQLRRLTDGPDSGRYRWRKPVDGSPVLIKNISHCSGKMHRARFNRLHLFERANRISLESDSARETWLILPVVICLSQRLSHACLSISIAIAKLRMAH